jgi:predicted enzyme related to lactoylglutathione lyase
MAGRHGDIHWTELQTRDPRAARRFYEAVLGWEIVETAMGGGAPYLVCLNRGEPVAGIFSIAAPEFADVPPNWFSYIAVDDVDRTLATVTAAGGRVARPAFDVPDVGRIAIVADPTGAMVGVMTPARRG